MLLKNSKKSLLYGIVFLFIVYVPCINSKQIEKKENPFDYHLSLGTGLGISYGYMGVNIEYDPIKYFGFILGGGFIYIQGTDDIMFSPSVGMCLYPIGNRGKFIPRVAIFSGPINHVYDGIKDDYFLIRATALGGGIHWHFLFEEQHFSLNFEAYPIIVKSSYDHEGALKISMGLAWHR